MYGELVKKYLDLDLRHEWYTIGMSKERFDNIEKYYEERYRKANPWENKIIARGIQPSTFFKVPCSILNL